MMVQAGIDAVCAEMVSRFPDRQFTMGVGGRVPMGVAAGSIALMSIMPEADCLALLETNAPRYLSHPSVAVNMAYYLPGEGGLGLPVRATNPYELNAAISFTAPLEMMTEDWLPKIIDELRDCLGHAI